MAQSESETALRNDKNQQCGTYTLGCSNGLPKAICLQQRAGSSKMAPGHSGPTLTPKVAEHHLKQRHLRPLQHDCEASTRIRVSVSKAHIPA